MLKAENKKPGLRNVARRFMLRRSGGFRVRLRPFERLSTVSTLIMCCRGIDKRQQEFLVRQRAARRSTARLGAHQEWSRKFRSRWKWMMHSVLLRLPDRPALSEHSNTRACPFRPAGNQQTQQMRIRTSERWPQPVSLGSSWFSPLVGELWLRVAKRRHTATVLPRKSRWQ